MLKYGGRQISIIEADRLSKVVCNPFCIKLFQYSIKNSFFVSDLSRDWICTLKQIITRGIGKAGSSSSIFEQ